MSTLPSGLPPALTSKKTRFVIVRSTGFTSDASRCFQLSSPETAFSSVTSMCSAPPSLDSMTQKHPASQSAHV
jgi:hypothetical protein